MALPALSSPALAYTLDSNNECESLPLRGSLYVLLDLNNLDDAGLLGEAVEISVLRGARLFCAGTRRIARALFHEGYAQMRFSKKGTNQKYEWQIASVFEEIKGRGSSED